MATIFNVLDFGAKGDGINDDTHAIQLAIDAAFKAGGGEVYLLQGIFIISGASADGGCLTLKSNVTLAGAGQNLTTLKLKDGSSGDIDGMVRTSSVHNTDGAALNRLTLDGNQANTDGTVNGFVTGADEGSAAHAKDITVSQVTFTNLSGDGVHALAQTAGLTVQDSLAVDNLGDGFATRFDDKGSASFYDNEAANNDGDGFDLQYSAYSADTDRTYLKDLDLNANGHRFEIGLSGNLTNAIDAGSFVFADAAAPEVTLLAAARGADHAIG